MSGLLGRKHTHPLDDATVVSVFSDLELRVDLKERLLPCGHTNYWLSLNWYSEEKREWLDIGVLHAADVERMIALLQEANAYVKDL